MRTNLLEFDLPRDLIATEPAHPPDSARLLVCSRTDLMRIEHRAVRDLPDLLDPGDRLVFNTTRVLPARLVGTNLETRGGVEGLFLRELDAGPDGAPDPRPLWHVLLKARRFRAGRRVGLSDATGNQTPVVLELVRPSDDEAGGWVVAVETPDDWARGAPAVLERVGSTPLPPYIRSARKEKGESHTDAEDRAWYQTVLAAGIGKTGPDRPAGSVAAPTAGLHFTPDLLERLASRSVERSDVTLHVGPGTFKPIETDSLEDHPMHAEWCTLAPTGHAALEPGARGRVIPVGSTSARTLESFALEAGHARGPGDWLETRLLIAPGYRWRVAGGLLTNFHLPRSTLLAMVASMFGEGDDAIERLRAIYAEAVRERYRFFSYGDAMLILP